MSRGRFDPEPDDVIHQRPCPVCGAGPGEWCYVVTPSDPRQRVQPHTARTT